MTIALEDRALIGDLVIAYAFAVDERNWTAFEALFVPDARIDYIFNENPYLIGQDTVVDPADYPGLLDDGFFEDRKDLRARVAWTSDDDVWTLALWGKNLLDQKRLGGVSDISVLFGTPFATMDQPRTWGIEIETRF